MRYRWLKLAALGLALYGAFGLLYVMWWTWWKPKPTWELWVIERRWEAGRDRSAPPDKQWAPPWRDLYSDRMTCEANGRASLQNRQRVVAAVTTLSPEAINRLRMLGVPDPTATEIRSSHLTEGGLGLVEVNGMGETSTTQAICLQVGQRPEGL